MTKGPAIAGPFDLETSRHHELREPGGVWQRFEVEDCIAQLTYAIQRERAFRQALEFGGDFRGTREIRFAAARRLLDVLEAPASP